MVDLFRYVSLFKMSLGAGATFMGIQVIYYSTIFNLDIAGYSKIVNQ